jgi:hypothetical protein
MATIDQKKVSNLEQQAIALAEQLGRIAGTVEGTAETWLNDPALAAQLTRVRDGATRMLRELQAATARGRKSSKSKYTKPAARALQAGDRAHAAGKRRRGPAPSMRGVKKSDERIPKSRTAAAVRQRRKSYA